jgi:phosphatidate cytidylyltransferase
MASRLASASVVISLLLGIIWLDLNVPLAGVPGLWLVPLLLLILLLASLESTRMLQQAGQAPSRWAVAVGVVGLNVAVAMPMLMDAFGSGYPDNCLIGRGGLAAVGIGLALLWICLVELFRYDATRSVLGSISSGIFSVAHVGLLGSFLILLRDLGPPDEGMAALLSMIIVTKVSDSGAYFVGRSLGKHKLAPQLSPGKTIEGLIGGLLTGGLAAVLFFEVIIDWIVDDPFRPGIVICLAYGIVLTLVGVAGDLSVSLLKREAKVKDSSSWLPGLGGLLDMLDSLLFAGIIAYLFWAARLMSG